MGIYERAEEEVEAIESDDTLTDEQKRRYIRDIARELDEYEGR
jgi:hypothetical protein